MSWDSSTVLSNGSTYLLDTNASEQHSRSHKNYCVSCFGNSTVTPGYVAFYICAILIVITTVFGNLLVIVSVCHFRQLHTPTNVLLLSLAVADFLVGLVMPFEFIRMIEACWLFSVLTCQCLNFFAFHLTNTSVQNVVLIAFDRYLALSNPFLYAKPITLKPAILVAMASWVVSSVGVFALLYTNGFFQASVTPCVTQCPIAVDQESSLIGFVVTLVLPCSIMFVLYLKIFAIARRHVNAIRAANSQGKPNAKLDDDLKRSERKAAKALGILVLVFLLCVVPYFLASVLADFIPGRVFEDVLSYTSLILYLNSSFNPILYALFYPWFQKSMKMILTGRICSSVACVIFPRKPGRTKKIYI